MNKTNDSKTIITADVHPHGILSNLFSSFLDKLGEVLIGDFKSLFENDNFKSDDVSFKSGETPFNKNKIKEDSGGRDPILYPDYQTQEKNAGTWGTENNPDEKGLVDSNKTNQIVILDKGSKIQPDNSDRFIITYSPVLSKGYEGFVVAIAEYYSENEEYSDQTLIKRTDFKKWIKDLKKEWNIPDTLDPEVSESQQNEVQSSKKMIVTLNKIVGSNYSDISLTSIYANYAISDANIDLNTILSDDNFVNSIPSSETTYIVSTGEDESLDICEYCGQNDCFDDIYQLLINETADIIDYIKIARWGAKGAIRSEFISILQNIEFSFEEILNKLGEWMIIETNKIPQINHSNDIIDFSNLTAIETVNDVQNKVNKYISDLDLVSVNFDSGQLSYINTFKESICSLCKYSLSQIKLQ